MGIKMVTIDIDGTLVNSERKLTPKVKETIKKASDLGIDIVLTTGRPSIGVIDLVKELGLENDHSFIITYNGGMIQNAGTKEVILRHSLSLEDYQDVELLSRKLGVHFHTQDADTMYTANTDISPYTINEAMITGIPLQYKPVNDMTKDIKLVKAMMIDHEDVLDAAIKKIPQEYYDRFSIVKSAPYYLEILDPKATKGESVKELAQYLNIKQEEVMAIGDNENDLSMIEYAGIGVAMGNALESVKNIADKITKTNDDDGVAYAINEWVLNDN
ncbi:sugar-phosphatase [Vagococcus martis]|uniref:Sugar-phosphatase n=1 Tax=Vagococcus martis TaxID=1768210 RepID=A0A1V4DJ52_9ENTE|nr:sugar-phosphatase [Vagococcus martis]OPF88535.1 sugar-phosphatase [Vagococcus martis]